MIAARRNSNGVKIGASTGIARDSVIELITSEKKSPRVAGGCGGGGARCTAAFDWTGGVRREPFIKRSPRSPGTLISFRESLRCKKEEIPMQKQTTLVRRSSLAVVICAVGLALSPAALAQVASAEGYVPPDDTPAIKVGFTLFADYTYTDSPTAKNTDGSDYNPNAFNVSRAYINITGQLHHLLSFRITPDITRETGTGSSLNGSYTFRLKYGFGQFNIDACLPNGSWARLGLQQPPYIDYAEGIYRYRFQSAIMVDRDGFLTSSDLGLSSHVNFPDNYGDVHVGIYNGEGVRQSRGERPEGLPGPRLSASARERCDREWLADHGLLELGQRREGTEERPLARRHDI